MQVSDALNPRPEHELTSKPKSESNADAFHQQQAHNIPTWNPISTSTKLRIYFKLGFALEPGNSQTVKARRTLLCGGFFTSASTRSWFILTVCCSGCQVPPGSESYSNSFCLTGRVLGILRPASRCQPAALLQAQARSPGSGAARSEDGCCDCHLRARRLRQWSGNSGFLGGFAAGAPACTSSSKWTFYAMCCAMWQTCS